jgi:flagellar biosynthesis/type III secretory pathway chaperone
MRDTVLENMLETQKRHLQIAESLGETIKAYVENKKDKDMFLDKDAVAEITGLGVDTAVQIIQKINKKIKKTKPDAVHNGRVLASNFYQHYRLGE